MEGIPSGDFNVGSSTAVQSPKTIEGISGRGQPRRGKSMTNGEVTTYLRGGVVVTSIDNEDHLVHVPMSLRARTSTPDG